MTAQTIPSTNQQAKRNNAFRCREPATETEINPPWPVNTFDPSQVTEPHPLIPTAGPENAIYRLLTAAHA
jgi:hypothetical protein